MIEGYGNNPEDKAEGMRYKNTIGSYSHGPILKNENIARSIAQEIIKSHQEKMSKPK
jgi:CobQ-like glutamine amidotransferase family enzyme